MNSNAALSARRAAAVVRGVAHATPFFVDRAFNSEIWDVEGRRYIDFAAGIAVVNTGHCHPRVIAAAQAQMARFTHTAFQVSAYEPYIELAERLNRLAPFTGPAKTVLMSTGAEAVENAVKIARRHTGRQGVIAFTGAFHGRTALTSALTGKVDPYKAGFGISPAGIFHLPFPIPHHGVSVEDTLRALDRLFAASIAPADVAAIIIEPVQGEGGFYVAPPELLRELRARCDLHGILLIADEVQAGFARTGRMFGIEHSGVEPDLVTVAKGIAGGLPLSGVIGRAAIMDAPGPGGLGGTYGGNPVACAAALSVLDVIDDEGLLQRSDALGVAVRRRLEQFAAREDLLPINAIRGLGAMVGFEITRSRISSEPDPQATRGVVARALEKGLVVLSCGIYGNTIRLLMPLTIEDSLLTEGLDLLEAALVA